MKKSYLKKYARLIVRKGANVKKGQEVIINANLDQPEFITLLVEEAYKMGASRVSVEWSHPPLNKLGSLYMSLDTLSQFPKWREEKLKNQAEKLPAVIHIISADPDAMKGADQAKLAQATQKTFPLIKPYIEALESKYQWVIAAVPSLGWAEKVFPNLKGKKAINALWDAILATSRVDDENVLKTWDEHNSNLQKRSQYLTDLKLDYLHYVSKNGTDFKVWLNPEGRWIGGGETTLSGRFFNPNIPTEEVFTTPIAGKAEGKVVASLPLSYRGELIEDFYFVFKNGVVSEVHARKGEELLKQMISMDEGAKKLGEVALVPFTSPIRQKNIIFYSTLFDENAACHLAIGRGFNETLIGYEKLSKEEIAKKGVNQSMNHVDFMIGNEDLNIDGYTTKGEKIAIFRQGEWAFKIK